MNAVEVTDYTNLAPLRYSGRTDGKNVSSTPIKMRKKMKCAQNRRRTSSMGEQALCKV